MHILSADYPKIQTLDIQENKQLHKNVKIGDLLKVEIIDSLQKQLKLLLADGTIIEAKLDKAMELYIGQQIMLKVKDISGKQILMEVNNQSGVEHRVQNDPGVENILGQLGLAKTAESEAAVKVLMQKMLPITKENIRQIEFGLKTSQVPIDTLLSMLENEIPITPSHLNQMESYSKGEIKLQSQLENMIKEILLFDNLEHLEKVHTLLTNLKEHLEPQDQLNKDITSPVNQKLSQIGSRLENHEEINRQISKTPLLQKANEEIIEIDQKKQGELLSLKLPLENLKKEISGLFKELFFVRPEQLKDNTDFKLKNISKLYKDIYELIDSLEKIESKMTNQPQKVESSVYTDIKSNIEFLNIANKYDAMIHIPFIIQDEHKHAELYIFNQRKNSKKNYEEASMLISLETVSLGTIDTYIRKHNKKIDCQFKTDNKNIEKIIQSQIMLLKTRLKDKGYDLTSVSYLSNSQSFLSVEDKQSKNHSGRYRFDTKV